MIVSADVLDAVRLHAVEANRERQGFESLGALVLAGEGRAERYVRLANGAGAPFQVRQVGDSLPRRPGGLPLIWLHSHPVGDASPSEADVRWMASHGLDVFAIYSIRADELRVWRLEGDEFAEVEFQILP